MTASVSLRAVPAEAAPVGLPQSRLYDELAKLARIIEAARHDIAALRPDEIRQKHLPTATDELDAIVGATSEAFNGSNVQGSTLWLGFQSDIEFLNH